MNIGHGDPRFEAQAVVLAYAGPGMVTRVRAELGEALAKITPSGLDHSSLA